MRYARIAAAVVAVLIATASIVGAQTAATHRIVDANGDVFDVAAPFTVDTIPTPTTTTTSAPLPTPTGDRFDILLRGELADGTRAEAWTAPYYRNLPYTAAHTVGWVDGDRVAYRCAYMHLDVDGAIVGRVTFTRPTEAGAYAVVNDKFMDEGVRYYNGDISDGTRAQLNDCPAPTQDYGPPVGDDYRPLIFYTLGGELLENRSYTATTGTLIASGDLTFRELERIDTPFVDVGALGQDPHTVYQRVTVGSYLDTGDGNGPQLFIVVYYDTLDPAVRLSETP